MRPWLLLAILSFIVLDRQTQRHFNVSSPSSRRGIHKDLTRDSKSLELAHLEEVQIEKHLQIDVDIRPMIRLTNYKLC